MEVIEERVRRIEERLANIEKHGIVVSNDTMTIIKKEVDEYKKALLRGVLQDNIMLREET
uniref:Magnetosome protein Man1 n=1 Tax=uncultured Nitrospirota bacterium TaxID=170969 RepID=A0A142BTW2_9BACT|nr:magnetosome protein Man1 [uncultured Nitrospirota bacterium]